MISVIVPIYHVEKYLPACVESICAQTYSNIEIILVDDGSPDRCGEMCDEFAQKDNRIRVIHKINGGLSDARNAGIEAASGEYIAFIDSDDTIDSRMLELLLQTIENTKTDISCCLYTEYPEGEKPFIHQKKYTQPEVLDSVEALKRLFSTSTGQEIIACNKLYRHELFEDGIRFPVGKLHEDNFTTYQLFGKAGSVSFLDCELYFYLRRKNSITGCFNPRRMEAIQAGEEAMEYVRQRKLPLKLEAEAFYFRINTGLLNAMICSHSVNLEFRKKIEHNLFHSEHSYFSNPYFSKKNKLLMLVYKFGGYRIYQHYILHVMKVRQKDLQD